MITVYNFANAADVSRLEQAVGFRPHTSVEDGVAKFVEWYRGYYKDMV